MKTPTTWDLTGILIFAAGLSVVLRIFTSAPQYVFTYISIYAVIFIVSAILVRMVERRWTVRWPFERRKERP